MIELRNLESYIEGELLFRIPSLDFAKGNAYQIIGENGCGKSSLLKSFIGQFEFIEGDMEINGDIIYQPQNVYLYQKTPRDNFNLVGLKTKEMEDALQRLDIDMLLDRPVDVLSGGQRQKVAFIRSIFLADEILILDEPFSQMDKESVWIALEMMEEWMAEDEHRILIAVSHDSVKRNIFDYHVTFVDKTTVKEKI